ncbi:hypothetical protein FEI13_18485 [Halomonas urmiana]|uniref:Uncharacterized protein n=1 Tax=Halomonas urmiana TaxID=490901 RepID=A0A5R8M6I5_9GAMM|nr:hypothetical protein [Halomonas urmiana]TLF45085.1 hypothetical protein FEI13_18485 [Halomonas urmiana]
MITPTRRGLPLVACIAAAWIGTVQAARPSATMIIEGSAGVPGELSLTPVSRRRRRRRHGFSKE